MSILANARRDFNSIIASESGFRTAIILTTPLSVSFDTYALCSTHRISVNPETGQIVNAKNVHFTISEQALIDLSYPVRNGDNEVALRGHLITFADSAGVNRSYSIDETWPDETLGVIVCMLGEYDNG